MSKKDKKVPSPLKRNRDYTGSREEYIKKVLQLANQFDQLGFHRQAAKLDGFLRTVTAKGNLKALMDKYWKKQKDPGLFTYCMDWVKRHPETGIGEKKKGKSPEQFCAWMHKQVTGKWPGEHRGKKKSKKKSELSAKIVTAQEGDTKGRLIHGLNEDLAGELNAIVMYVTYAAKVTGPLRPQLFKFLMGEVEDEIGHAEFLANKIVALGGKPTTVPHSVPEALDNKAMMQNVLSAEQKAVKDYTERASQAEAYGDKALQVHLEDIVVDEQRHYEETEKMLRSWGSD